MTDPTSRLARLEERQAAHGARLEDAENELEAVRGLETAVVRVEGEARSTRELLELELERASEERRVNREFRAEVRANFERGHAAHAEQAAATGLSWKGLLATFLAVAAAIGVPIAAAFIGAPGK